MLESDYHKLSPRMRNLSSGRYAWCVVIFIFNLLMASLGVYLICCSAIYSNVLGVLLLAFQMNHAYLIMHECGHFAFFKGIKINLIIGNIVALLCLYPNEIKKNEHTGHHRFTGGFDEPVAKKAMRNFSLVSPAVDKIMRICWRLWIPIFTANELVTTWKSSLLEGKKSSRIVAFFSLTIYLILFITVLNSKEGILLLVKFACAIYIYMMLLEFFTMPHHVPSVIDHRYGSVPFHEQDKYTQSCTPLPGILSLLFMLNFNYHVAHHFYPYVHFTRLEEAHHLIGKLYPNLLETKTEWEIMASIRARSFKDVFKKYYPESELMKSTISLNNTQVGIDSSIA